MGWLCWEKGINVAVGDREPEPDLIGHNCLFWRSLNWREDIVCLDG